MRAQAQRNEIPSAFPSDALGTSSISQQEAAFNQELGRNDIGTVEDESALSRRFPDWEDSSIMAGLGDTQDYEKGTFNAGNGQEPNQDENDEVYASDGSYSSTCSSASSEDHITNEKSLPLESTNLPSGNRPSLPPRSQSESHIRRTDAPRRPRLLPHTSSQLFPPFYNRPPTPLPPSPSLTSLLRPAFSAHSSRPSTPDTSDAESLPHRGRHLARGGGGSSSGGGGAQNFETSSAATGSSSAPPPRHSVEAKVPTYEYYGFALYLFSSLSFLIYLLWALLPSAFLHRLGIWYYPNRWWAIAIPAWLVIFLVYVFVALASWNTQYLTRKVGDAGGFVDGVGVVAIVDAEGKIMRKKRELGRAASTLTATTKALELENLKRGRNKQGYHGQNAKGFASPAKATTAGSPEKRYHKPRKHHKHHHHHHHHGRNHASKTQISAAAKDAFAPANLLGKDVNWRQLWSEGTDACMDIPIGGVCEVLYGLGRVIEDEDPD